jgi:hypothetical protein
VVVFGCCGGGGVASSRELDELGFARVMDGLGRLGFRSAWSGKTFGGQRAGMASSP